jgi:hypothetical protein
MVFGFGGLTLPCHGAVERDVEYAFLPYGGGPPLSVNLEIVALKRRGLWQHPVRNRRVAALARALSAGGAELTDNFPDLAAVLGHPGPGGVVLLVENQEHAVCLSERLRDWPVVTGTGSVQFAPAGRPVQAVVTAAAAERIDLSGVEVVVRADGGVGLPPLSLPDCLAAPRRGRLVVVDVADRHHPVLRRRTRERRQAYEDCDWTPAGEDRVEALAGRFLATRPTRNRRGSS